MSRLTKLANPLALILALFLLPTVFIAAVLFGRAQQSEACPFVGGDKITLVNGIEGIVRSPRAHNAFGEVDPRLCSYYVVYFDKMGVKQLERLGPGEYKQ